MTLYKYYTRTLLFPVLFYLEFLEAKLLNFYDRLLDISESSPVSGQVSLTYPTKISNYSMLYRQFGTVDIFFHPV